MAVGPMTVALDFFRAYTSSEFLLASKSSTMKAVEDVSYCLASARFSLKF